MAAASIAFGALAVPALAAAESAPLDLRGAVAYALDHNANIANRRATLANDEAQYAKDHSNEYPPVTGLLQNQVLKSANLNGGSVTPQGAGSPSLYGLTPQSVFSQNTAQVGSTWTIYNGSYNQITAQRAKQQVQTDRDDLRRAQETLAQDVSSAYFTVSVRRENVRLNAADYDYQSQLLRVARDNERVGRAAGVDVLRSHVNELRAQAALATAQSDDQTAREALSQTIGAPPDQPFTFDDALPEPPLVTAPLSDLVATAQAHRPDIGAAVASLANARLANSIIDTDRYPTLQISGAFGNQFVPTTQQQTLDFRTGAFVTLPRTDPGFWQIGATETLQIGLIDYGARHAQHRAARIGIAAAQAALDTARYAVETDIRQALRGAQTAAANLATAKEAAALGAESARIAQLQYKNGLISLTDATQAERDNLSAQNDLVNARVTYIGSIVHLRVAEGTSDPLAIVDLRPA